MNTFGVNLWWTCPTLTADAKATQELLEKYGFEKADMAEPSDRVEVSRAVRSFQNRRTKEDRRLAELANEQGDKVVYGLLDRQQVNGDQVGFEQRTTITYDKNANVTTVTGELAGEVEVALAAYKDKVTDQDVRNFLRRLVKMCHGVAKRPSGGIYFVPAKFATVIDSARGFLAELNSGARLYVERVVDDAEARQNVWVSVESDLDKQLQGILDGVERTEKRVSALRNQEARVGELRDLMATYQELLGTEAKYEEMAQKLDGAVQTIAEKIAKLQPALPVAPATPGNGRGHRQEAYFEAVVGVLKAANEPLIDNEIAKRVTAAGYDGPVPANVYAHLYARSRKGLVKLVGPRKFALV